MVCEHLNFIDVKQPTNVSSWAHPLFCYQLVTSTEVTLGCRLVPRLSTWYIYLHHNDLLQLSWEGHQLCGDIGLSFVQLYFKHLIFRLIINIVGMSPDLGVLLLLLEFLTTFTYPFFLEKGTLGIRYDMYDNAF